MNIYKAFYHGKECEVEALTSYEAQKKAATIFKARKLHEITVVLCEKDGEQIAQSTIF